MYDAIAAWAARKAGLNPATAEAAAEDASARAIRDECWMETDRRLADEQTYTADEVIDWLTEIGVATSRSAVYRARRRRRAQLRAVRLRSELARQIVDAAGDDGESGALRGARLLMAQKLFEATQGLSPEQLDGLSPTGVIKLAKVIGELSRADAQTDLIRQRLTQMRSTAKKAVDDAVAVRRDGRLSREDVYRLIDDVMKGES